MNLPGIPESIDRDRVLALVESLGLDPHGLVSLELDTESIRAEVYALDLDGHPYPTHDLEPAVHHIRIPITERNGHTIRTLTASGTVTNPRVGGQRSSDAFESLTRAAAKNLPSDLGGCESPSRR